MEASDVNIESIVDVDTGLIGEPVADSTNEVPAAEANLEASLAATVDETVHEERTQPMGEDATSNTAAPGVSTPQSGANHQTPDQGRTSSGSMSADNLGSPSDSSRVTIPNLISPNGNQERVTSGDSNNDPQQPTTQHYQWMIQQQQRAMWTETDKD